MASNNESKKVVERRMKEIQSDIIKVENNHALGKVEDHVFERIRDELRDELIDLKKECNRLAINLSNITNKVTENMELAQNLSEYWQNGSYYIRKQLQQLIFPKGFFVDTKTRLLRTNEINQFFVLMSRLSDGLIENKKGLNDQNTEKSFSVAGAGLFHDPERGVLYKIKALNSFHSLNLLFPSNSTNKFVKCHKKEDPHLSMRTFSFVAGAGFEPTTYGL